MAIFLYVWIHEMQALLLSRWRRVRGLLTLQQKAMMRNVGFMLEGLVEHVYDQRVVRHDPWFYLTYLLFWGPPFSLVSIGLHSEDDNWKNQACSPKDMEPYWQCSAIFRREFNRCWKLSMQDRLLSRASIFRCKSDTFLNWSSTSLKLPLPLAMIWSWIQNFVLQTSWWGYQRSTVHI